VNDALEEWVGGGAMWISSDHRGVRIYVRGEFIAPRQWLIQATVVNASAVDKGTGAGNRQRTLAELWQGIMLESRVGRSRGAVAIRVVVEGDHDIAALFAATDKADETRCPACAPE
jgi:hypothetical protein